MEQIQKKIELADEGQTELFGQDLALCLVAGDCVCLRGTLGAGKTSLARSIIRCLAKNDELEVPSPTFLLEQTYNTVPPLAHYDFYRIEDPSEIEELGLEEALEQSIVLIEWPDNCAQAILSDAIHLEIAIGQGDKRSLSLAASDDFMRRFRRSHYIRQFLNQNWRSPVKRRPLTGDASTRSYELVSSAGDTRVLMNAQKQPDGPVIKKYHKPYSQIAHLAEDVSAFVAVDQILIKNQIRAPRIYAEDLDQGILLLENLGNTPILDRFGTPIKSRYKRAIELLVSIHLKQWPTEIALGNKKLHTIASYDRDAFLIEVELLTEWFIPHILGRECTEEEQSRFEEIWDLLFEKINRFDQSLVLRDFHSPNLIWLEHETGLNQISVIDFQDSVIGPQSYDVASLAQDARVDISLELELELVQYYIEQRLNQNTAFDESAFRQSYAIMAAHRATKVLGIFVRLHKRDKKSAYLEHIPRIREYLERAFDHPILSQYRLWFTEIMNEKN